MPITEDILDHDLLGPAIRQGLQQGFEEGRILERRAVTQRLMTKRYGPLTESDRERLAALSPTELSEVIDRILEELFGQTG